MYSRYIVMVKLSAYESQPCWGLWLVWESILLSQLWHCNQSYFSQPFPLTLDCCQATIMNDRVCIGLVVYGLDDWNRFFYFPFYSCFRNIHVAWEPEVSVTYYLLAPPYTFCNPDKFIFGYLTCVRTLLAKFSLFKRLYNGYKLNTLLQSLRSEPFFSLYWFGARYFNSGINYASHLLQL